MREFRLPGSLPTLRQHPRTPIVREAEIELLNAFNAIAHKHALTAGEALHVINAFSHGHVGHVAKCWIREERHGSEAREGDLSAHRNGCGDPKCEGC